MRPRRRRGAAAAGAGAGGGARDVGHRRGGAAGVPAREAAHRARRQVVERRRAVAMRAAHREHLRRRGAVGAAAAAPAPRLRRRRRPSARRAAAPAARGRRRAARAGISCAMRPLTITPMRSATVDRDAEVLLDQQHRDLALGRRARAAPAPPARRSPAPGPRSARPSPAGAGSSSSARPIASICCSPPDSCAPPWPRALGQAREHRVDAVDVAPAARHQAQRLVDRQRRPHAPALRHVGDAALRDLVRRAGRGSPRRPAGRCRVAGTSPVIALHSVVLPMPLRPTMPSTPRSSVRLTPCSAWARP